MKKFMEPKLEVLAYATEECVSVSGGEVEVTTTTGDPEETERD